MPHFTTGKDGSSVIHQNFSGLESIEICRAPDGRRIGFGWQVNSHNEGVELIFPTEHVLALIGITNRPVTVYSWDQDHPDRKPKSPFPSIEVEH